MLVGVLVVMALSCWIDTANPMCDSGDTMKYKLKYVRLRPMHEEERQRTIKSIDLESREILLRQILNTDKNAALPNSF